MINTKAVARRTLVALALPTTVAGFFLGIAGPAAADTPFGTPGQVGRMAGEGYLDWIVPAGVTSLHVHLVGGSGADGGSGAGSPGGRGGFGGIVDETVAVKPGQAVILMPGSAASLNGDELASRDAFGGFGGPGDAHGHGGRGGAASWVIVNDRVVGIAGGGGGGGGGGAVYNYNGGQGGDAGQPGKSGSGAGAGSGGPGNIAGNEVVHHGEDQSGTPPLLSYAGGGGGGGAGWNGASLGGGIAGQPGTYGGGGGGGAAGGLSYGVDPNTSYGTRTVSGDGVVLLDWTVASTTTSKLTAPASTPQGRPVTLTDTITPAITGGPAMTGTVTFEMQDIYGSPNTVIGTAPVVNGVATFTTTTLPAGNSQALRGVYSGDTNYQGSTSDFAYPKITAPVTTIALNPTTVAFGNRTLNSILTKTVQLTNTGSINWSWDWAATDNGDVNMPSTTCGSLKPGENCTVTISYKPSQLGAITAHITLHSNFGNISIPVTGTGVAPAPTVTAVSPTSGSHLGGTRITVTGTNFVNVSSITVGGVKATAVSCSSATTCSATTPAGTAGARDVKVVTATGTSAVSTADRFTYL